MIPVTCLGSYSGLYGKPGCPFRPNLPIVKVAPSFVPGGRLHAPASRRCQALTRWLPRTSAGSYRDSCAPNAQLSVCQIRASRPRVVEVTQLSRPDPIEGHKILRGSLTLLVIFYPAQATNAPQFDCRRPHPPRPPCDTCLKLCKLGYGTNSTTGTKQNQRPERVEEDAMQSAAGDA